MSLLCEKNIEEKNEAFVFQNETIRKRIISVGSSVDIIEYACRIFSDKDVATLWALRFGIRLLNAYGACSKLAFAGYFQPSISIIRDIFETGLLLNCFAHNPSEIILWAKMKKEDRKKTYHPAKVRKRVSTQHKVDWRTLHERYDRLNTLGAHIDPDGFIAISSDKMLTQIGPFYDEKRFTAIIEELQFNCNHATFSFLKCLNIDMILKTEDKLTFVQRKLKHVISVNSENH